MQIAKTTGLGNLGERVQGGAAVAPGVDCTEEVDAVRQQSVGFAVVGAVVGEYLWSAPELVMWRPAVVEKRGGAFLCSK
jgi:hypothetical protein